MESLDVYSVTLYVYLLRGLLDIFLGHRSVSYLYPFMFVCVRPSLATITTILV